MTDLTSPESLPALAAPAGFAVTTKDQASDLLIVTVATTPAASASAVVPRASAQEFVDLLVGNVARQAAQVSYPHRLRTSRPLERIEAVRGFLAGDPDDAEGWADHPCVLTCAEVLAVQTAVAAKAGAGLWPQAEVVQATTSGPQTYDGPAWDLEGRKREVKGARIVGRWCATTLVVDDAWSH